MKVPNKQQIYDKYIAYLEKYHPECKGDFSIRQTVEKYGLGPFQGNIRVTEVTPLEDYMLRCKINTGEIKLFDMNILFDEGKFLSLKNKKVFDTVYIRNDCPAWKNNIDIGIAYILLYGEDI